MKKNTIFSLLLIMALVLFVTACSPAQTNEEAVPEDTSSDNTTTVEEPADPMASLVEAAQAEAEIVSYGLPDDWVNYGGMWELYESKYGIPHLDTDMGSGEIIAALQAEKGAGVADITDLGVNFANQVVVEGLSQPYKHAYWDELPDYAKDADGYWSAA